MGPPGTSSGELAVMRDNVHAHPWLDIFHREEHQEGVGLCVHNILCPLDHVHVRYASVPAELDLVADNGGPDFRTQLP